MSVRVRRVHGPPEPDDGVRGPVDQLQPRGPAKDAARVDEWPKGLTPSTGPRRWYHADDRPYEEFREHYEAELAAPEAAELPEHVRELAGKGPGTLLTAARSPKTAHAEVPARLLADRRGEPYAVRSAAARPAARPEKRQPPRKVPSRAL